MIIRWLLKIHHYTTIEIKDSKNCVCSDGCPILKDQSDVFFKKYFLWYWQNISRHGYIMLQFVNLMSLMLFTFHKNISISQISCTHRDFEYLVLMKVIKANLLEPFHLIKGPNYFNHLLHFNCAYKLQSIDPHLIAIILTFFNGICLTWVILVIHSESPP